MTQTVQPTVRELAAAIARDVIRDIPQYQVEEYLAEHTNAPRDEEYVSLIEMEIGKATVFVTWPDTQTAHARTIANRLRSADTTSAELLAAADMLDQLIATLADVTAERDQQKALLNGVSTAYLNDQSARELAKLAVERDRPAAELSSATTELNALRRNHVNAHELVAIGTSSASDPSARAQGLDLAQLVEGARVLLAAYSTEPYGDLRLSADRAAVIAVRSVVDTLRADTGALNDQGFTAGDALGHIAAVDIAAQTQDGPAEVSR